MPPAEQRLFTSEDTLRAITEKGQKDGDTFTIRVFRRVQLHSGPELVAAFQAAVTQHFVMPELWLPQVLGGGNFSLQAYHHSNPNTPVGGYVGFKVDKETPRDFDFRAVDAPDWKGPTDVQFPVRGQPGAQRQPDLPLYGISSPPAPGSGDSATRQNAWARSAGGGLHREDYGDDRAHPTGSWRAGAAALEAERRQLERDKLDAEREKHKAELLAKDEKHKSELATLKAELRAEIHGNKNAAGDPMLEFLKFMAQQQERAEARAAEDRRTAENRALEAQKQAAEDRRAADARFERLIEKISEKKEKDPIETLKVAADLFGKKGDGDAALKMVNQTVETMSMLNGAAMEFVDHAMRMNLGGGESESPVVKSVERLVKGISSMAKGAQQQQQRGFVPQGQPGIAAGGYPQQYAPQAQPGSQATPVAQVPPNQQHVEQRAQQQPPAPQQVASIIEQAEYAIKNHLPVAQVAAGLIDYFQKGEPTLHAALNDAGGDFELAFQKRLGAWLEASPQNKAYFASLVQELEKQLKSGGHYGDEETAAGPDDEGEEDTDESDVAEDGEEEGDEGGEE